MVDIIKAEFQKSKRTTTNKFIIIAPLLSILLSSSWGGGQNGAYNWWYTLFLPGMLSMISAQVITREKNLSYKGVLLYPRDKGVIWVGKILYISILLIFTSLILMIGMEVVGLVYGTSIPLRANMLATLVLILTFLFSIPINMFLTVQFNMFVAVLFNLGMTIMGVISYNTKLGLIFKKFPYGTPPSLMVPILHILPNGLSVTENSPLLNGDMILGDTVISITIFLILTALTTIWFRKKEVN